jgi:hypothetical protein
VVFVEEVVMSRTQRLEDQFGGGRIELSARAWAATGRAGTPWATDTKTANAAGLDGRRRSANELNQSGRTFWASSPLRPWPMSNSTL